MLLPTHYKHKRPCATFQSLTEIFHDFRYAKFNEMMSFCANLMQRKFMRIRSIDVAYCNSNSSKKKYAVDPSSSHVCFVAQILHKIMKIDNRMRPHAHPAHSFTAQQLPRSKLKEPKKKKIRVRNALKLIDAAEP